MLDFMQFFLRGQQDRLRWPVSHRAPITRKFARNHARLQRLVRTRLYVFTSTDARAGWQWVGNYIRPRVALPESWKRRVGLSLSTEISYQSTVYSPDTWTIEIRPIVDKAIGRQYLCFNATIDRSFPRPSVPQGVTLFPNVKVGYDVTKVSMDALDTMARSARSPASTRCSNNTGRSSPLPI